MPDFVQEKPRLGNQYDDDALLRSYLRWRLPPSMLAQIEPGLRQLGGRVVTDIQALAEQVEASPPRHVPFDAWGRRIDRIETSNAWSELDRISAREGIVAAAYERDGQFDKAIPLFQKAAKAGQNPNDIAYADISMAVCYFSQQKFKEAIPALEASMAPHDFWKCTATTSRERRLIISRHASLRRSGRQGNG